jgi:hypothetical protein
MSRTVLAILKVISALLNLVAMAGAVVGGFLFLGAVGTAETVFQQSSGSAMAMVIIIAPYCFARSFGEIVKMFDTEPKESRIHRTLES